MPRAADPRPIYYVYVLFRPSGIPCYIGKGSATRWLVSSKSSRSNQRLRRLIKKHGKPLPVTIIRDEITETEAFETEIALIAAIGRADQNKGPLLNLTDGGDGLSGHKHSLESRVLMSKNVRAALSSIPPELWRERAVRREAAYTKEEKSARGKAAAAKLTSEERIARAKTGNANLPPDQLARLADRINDAPFEVRSQRLKDAFARMPQEKRSERSRAGGLAIAPLLTSAEQSRRAQKGIDGNREWHSGTRWINNGSHSYMQKADRSLPEGYQYGRLPYTRSKRGPYKSRVSKA